ncbi:hypothetical protein CTW00_02002 [Streptococcus iniae]|nr:hypothetical protein CTW00_02002 [Streptococcus iniae]
MQQNPEDYQQVTVNNDISSLIAQFTDRDTSGLTSLNGTRKKVKVITGQVQQVASQIVSGTSIYYLISDGQIYKVKATRESSDQLPFLKVGDFFKAELGEENFLQNFKIEEKELSKNVTLE